MKKAIFPALLVCTILAIMGIQSFRPSPEAETNEQQLIAKANQFNLRFPQEKVYLQLDRSSYWMGDTIWFKAYLQNSPINTCNLNVELVNSYGVVISRKMCRAKLGLTYGDISLPDTLSSGTFEIRAYTNWMRNFDEQYFFRKNIVILNQSKNKTLRDPRELKKREVDFQFFPEGGSFVAGQNNRMAFKATDQNGMGVKVEGRILDRKGNEVVDFNTQVKGMGSFLIEPKEGEKYKAKVVINGDIFMNVDLPEVQSEGVSLAVDPNDPDSIHVQLSEKIASAITQNNHDYLLVGQSNGTIFFRKKMEIKNGVSAFSIGKDKFPTGITRFTLFDQNLLPRCERLIFVNHHDQITVKVEPDTTQSHQRDKVILDLYTLDKEEAPVLANLSISVYNTDNQLEAETYPENILTRFLISSELKGNIESPAYYFKDDSLSTLQALDNLLLTQGYRCYEWKAIVNDQYPKVDYEPEIGIKIKGNVKTLIWEKPVPNTPVNLMFLKSSAAVRKAVTDSSGYFEFPNYYIKDTISIILEAKNPEGKTPKKQNNVWVEMDKHSFEFPDYKYLSRRYQYLGYQYYNGQKVSITNSFTPNDLLKINRKWRITDTIVLNEVRVIKKKLTPGVRPLRLYDQADYVLDVNTDDDDLENVFLKLEDRFPNVVVIMNKEIGEGEVSVNIDYQDAPPILVIDGLVEFKELKETEPISDFERMKQEFKRPERFLSLPYVPQGLVDKIEVIKNAREYGNFEGGAICVFTKGRIGIYAEIPSSIGMKSATIIGYSVTHQFYSPKYEVRKPNEIKDDFRNTLYWNPEVQTDEEGQAWLEFYNSDQIGEVQVVVEGVTTDGKLCRGECKYNVVPK